MNPYAQVRILDRQPISSDSNPTNLTSYVNISPIKVDNKNGLHDYKLFKSLKQDLSPATIGFYDDKILPFIKDHPNLDKITPVDITYWIANRKTFNKKTGQFEKTNNQSAYYRALRSFCNWRENYFNLKANANLFHKLKPPKKEIKIMPALKLKQIELAIKAANNIRDKSIISLFAESSMRLSELIGIEYENIDFEGMNIKINPHQFRRSFVVLLKEKGVPITDIKENGGWTNLAMPEHYSKTYEYEQARKHYKAPLGDIEIGLPTLNTQ